MGIVTNIKKGWGQFVFENGLRKLRRDKKFVNLNEAKTIGIVYQLTAQTNFRKVKLLMKELTTPSRQVMVVGFVNRNDIPNYCIAANSGYFFDKKDLNWYESPKNDYIARFINKEFDILIDLSLEDIYPLRFISALSRSKFKVGMYAKESKKFLDFMIKPKKKEISIDELSEQIIHYLLILKSN
jgi:hypothetical protein